MTMLSTFLSIAAVVLIVAWLPILGRFFHAWRQRQNPVSLAICGVVALIIYTNVLLILVSSFKTNLNWALGVGLGFNALACVNIHLAFRWSEKKFQDQRSHVTKVEPLATTSIASGSLPPRPPPNQ